MVSSAELKLPGSLLNYVPDKLLKFIIHSPFSYLLSLIFGALLPLAFAPFNTWNSLFSYLIFFPLGLFLLQLIHSENTREGFYKGWLFGCGFFGVGVSWLYVAIHVFGAAHWTLAGTLTGLFIILLALHYAVLGWAVVKIKQHFSLHPLTLMLFYIPVIWVFMEWIRTWLLTGFPWLLVGYPMIQTPLSGYAPILGVYGLSFIVLLMSALLVARIRQIYCIIIVIVIFATGSYLNTIQWSSAVGKPLKIAMVQGNVNQLVKWNRMQLEKTKQLYVTLSKDQWYKQDVIVWPENAIPVFYHRLEHGFYHQLTQQARKTQTELVTGLPVFDDKTQHYYNALTNLGGQQGFYYKTHLVPFGEYVPLASLLRSLLHFFNMPMSGFSAGNEHQPLISIKGYPVVTSICYEDVFAADIITHIPASRFMINLSNNGWYGDSFAPHQHFEMARMRALETSRELIRSTTSGITALVNEKGRVKVSGPQFKSIVVTGEIQPRQGVTPFVYWGNYPILLLFFLAALYLFWLEMRVR